MGGSEGEREGQFGVDNEAYLICVFGFFRSAKLSPPVFREQSLALPHPAMGLLPEKSFQFGTQGLATSLPGAWPELAVHHVWANCHLLFADSEGHACKNDINTYRLCSFSMNVHTHPAIQIVRVRHLHCYSLQLREHLLCHVLDVVLCVGSDHRQGLCDHARDRSGRYGGISARIEGSPSIEFITAEQIFK